MLKANGTAIVNGVMIPAHQHADGSITIGPTVSIAFERDELRVQGSKPSIETLAKLGDRETIDALKRDEALNQASLRQGRCF